MNATWMRHENSSSSILEITKSRPKYRANHLEPATPDDRRQRDDRDKCKYWKMHHGMC